MEFTAEHLIDLIKWLAVGVTGGLCVAIKILWNKFSASASKCEADREELWEELGGVKDKLTDLKAKLNSCPTPNCSIRFARRDPDTKELKFSRPTTTRAHHTGYAPNN